MNISIINIDIYQIERKKWLQKQNVLSAVLPHLVMAVLKVQMDFMCIIPAKTAAFTAVNPVMALVVSRHPQENTNMEPAGLNAFGAGLWIPAWDVNTVPIVSTNARSLLDLQIFA